MRVILICLAVFIALGVVAAIGAGVFFFGNVKTMIEGFEETGNVLQDLEEEHPFEPPDDWTLDPERFEVYVQCREGLMELMRSTEEEFEETPEWKQPLKTFSAIPGVVKAVAETLQEKEMSLSEYRWYDREVDLVLRKAAVEETDPELAEFARAYREGGDAELDILAQMETEKSVEFDFDLEETGLDPRRILVPEANFELVKEYRDRLEATQDVARLAAIFGFNAAIGR